MQTLATFDWSYLLYGLAAVIGVAACLPLLVGAVYSKEFQRLFENAPPLQAQDVDRPADDRPLDFKTPSGRRLVGSLFPARSGERRGLIIFCHEYTGNRWLFQPYVDYLRDDGFDIFTFDFSNHGDSAAIDGYLPLQWVTEHEVEDVAAAVDYVTSEGLAPCDQIGLFGVSKGGSAAIVAASRDPRIRAVVTDGAFPTHSIVALYVQRWAHIVVTYGGVFRLLPLWAHEAITKMELKRIERRRKCRYPHVETSFRAMVHRPLFLIHGKRDNYVRTEVIDAIFNGDSRPQQFWIVSGAKHNKSVEVAPEEYRERVRAFFLDHLVANSD